MLALAAVTLTAHAAESQQEEEIITDFGTDDFVYIPKLVLNIGARTVSGPKSTFAGSGRVSSNLDYGDWNSTTKTGTANITRRYHDGYLRPDTRTATDVNGNAIPIASDGMTNTWGYRDDDQVRSDGLMTMNSYWAVITDTSSREKDFGSSYGMELTVTRDMGKLFNTRATWGIVAGASLNDINASMGGYVAANVTRLTDYYSLNGRTPPVAPYDGPSVISSTVTDANGNPILNSAGVAVNQTVDNTTLLGNAPLFRTQTTGATTNMVFNRWRLKGSYLTMRIGPTVFVPITEHFNASFSLGGVLVFAGSTYSVTQVLKPDTGSDIVDFVSDGVSELLPGYYVDANLNYAITDTAGAYLGGVYQSSGSYTQDIVSTTSAYSTKVDLSRVQGFRAGMTFRF